MKDQITDEFLSAAIETFRVYKTMAEKALAQISDEEFPRALEAESNSPAAIVKHVGGNLRSRWTDFLTTDGEKPDRNRDAEFAPENETRESVMRIWEIGWKRLFSALEALKPEDFNKTIRIRGENHTVIKALNRSLAHTASHVGQIVFLAKHFRSSDWRTLSISRGKSVEYNSLPTENRAAETEQASRYEVPPEFGEQGNTKE